MHYFELLQLQIDGKEKREESDADKTFSCALINFICCSIIYIAGLWYFLKWTFVDGYAHFTITDEKNTCIGKRGQKKSKYLYLFSLQTQQLIDSTKATLVAPGKSAGAE